jgi:FkbM family methyltransferase
MFERWGDVVSIRGHHVFAPALSAASEVWDVGANLGDFSVLMIQRFGCRCFAVEPSPQNFAAIPAAAGLEKRNSAVGRQSGTATLFLSSNSEGCSLIPGLPVDGGDAGQATVAVETMAGLGADRGRMPDLVKFDIEGSELDVLQSLTDAELLAVPQWTVEFHDFIDERMTPEVWQAKARFHRLGFTEIVAEAPLNVDCLFLQPARCGVTPGRALALAALSHVLLPARSFLIRLSGRRTITP